MPTLIVSTRDGEETRIEVTEPFFTLGRSSECTVQIRDRSLSKRHARFYLTADGYCVVDAGSKNGVFIGERRIDRALLRDGDRLRFGGQITARWVEVFDPADELPLLSPAGESAPAARAPAPSAHRWGAGTEEAPLELPLLAGEEVIQPVEQRGLPRLRSAPPQPLEERPEAEPPPVLYPRSAPPVLVPKSVPAPRARREETQRPLELVPDTPAPPPSPPEGLVVPLGMRSGFATPEPAVAAIAELDPVEAALARIRAVDATGDEEPDLLDHPRLERVKVWAARLGHRMVYACAAGLLLLVAMTLHSRHVMQQRWREGPAPSAPPREPAEDPAAVLYRQADAAASRLLFEQLVAQHPQSGWADLARARLAQLAPGPAQRKEDPAQQATLRRLEGALAAGRPVEAIEGYALLSRTAPTAAERGRFEQRRAQIVEQLWKEYEERRKATVDPLVADGRKAQAAAAAEKLLARYPLPRVREDLEQRIR